MPWFKVDDNLGFHHKVIAAGNPAMGLWVRAGSICAQQLTDGFVPDHMVAALGTKAQAERLVTVGLWDRAERGYTFHGWVERQPSRADVEAERAAARNRMRDARAKKKGVPQTAPSQVSGLGSGDVRPNTSRTSPEVLDSFGNPDPVPSHPVPSKTSSSADAETEFDKWWSFYPRKVGKGAAAKAYRAARKKVDADTLGRAMVAQIPLLTAKGPDFCPHAATWLNAERWTDEAPPAPSDESDWMRRRLS